MATFTNVHSISVKMTETTDREPSPDANYSIITLLQTYPVNLKENLVKKAEALGLENTLKDRKTEIQLKIEHALWDESQDERKFRQIATLILHDYETAKATKKSDRTKSQSNIALERSPMMVCSAPRPSEPNTQDLFGGDDSVLSDANDLSTARKTLFFPRRRKPRIATNSRFIRHKEHARQTAGTHFGSTLHDSQRKTCVGPRTRSV